MKISLISLNLNGAPFLENFLDSVHDEISSLSNTELILFDNGSTDHSVSMVKSRYPWVRQALSSRNVGFCLGCQEAARASEAEYYIFLNNDMVLEPGFVEEILKPLEKNKSIGISAGLVLNETGKLVDYAGGDMNVFGWGFQRYHKMPVEEFEVKTSAGEQERQFFGCGGALAISRNLWLDARGFDPDYFAFFEDVDLGWRVNLLGFRTVLASKARVRHKHHGTALSMPQPLRTFLLERNALTSVIKNYDNISCAKILPWAIAMLNERALIDSSTVTGDIFKGRWAEEVFSNECTGCKSEDLLDLQHSGKAGLKKANDILTV
jgi:GT2 family glycosyltransferase